MQKGLSVSLNPFLIWRSDESFAFKSGDKLKKQHAKRDDFWITIQSGIQGTTELIAIFLPFNKKEFWRCLNLSYFIRNGPKSCAFIRKQFNKKYSEKKNVIGLCLWKLKEFT